MNPGEEARNGDRDDPDSAVVEQPESCEVVEEAVCEADGDREREAQREPEPRRRILGQADVEGEHADEERRDPAEEEVIERAPQIEGEPIAEGIERASEIGRDIPAADPQRDLEPAEDVDRASIACANQTYVTASLGS
jgi:hypothetical protein